MVLRRALCRSWKHWRELCCAAGHFLPRDVEGQALVVAATGDGALNRRSPRCRARRIPVNAVDDKGQLYLPVPGAGAARAAFPSASPPGGASPTGRGICKGKIEAALPGGDGWNGILNIWLPGAPCSPRCRTKPPGAAVRGAIRRMYNGKGRPLEQAEFDALAARMEREGGDA